MRKELSYDQVIVSLRYQSDEMLYQGIILLLFVHDVMKEQPLLKRSFTFTRFEEGHILVTGVEEVLSGVPLNEKFRC